MGCYPEENLNGFGYNAATDYYLLILIGFLYSDYEPEQTEIHMFSFKTESWESKNACVNVVYGDLDIRLNVEEKFKSGSPLNGVLHWLVFSEDRMLPVIIAFDLIQMSLSAIPVQNHLTLERYKVYALRVTGGCLCVCCSVQRCEKAEMWVMKKYKEHSSWTKSSFVTSYDLSPICITEDGGIFGLNSTSTELEKLNDKGVLEYYYYGGDGRFVQSVDSLLCIEKVYCRSPVSFVK